MSNKLRLRATQKEEFHKAFRETLDLELFRQFLSHFEFDKKYKFIITNQQYKWQTLEAACNAYSFMSGSKYATLFQLTSFHRFLDFEPKISHFIKTGTHFIVIDKKSNTVIGGLGLIDLCEKYENHHVDQPYYPSKLMKHRQEINKQSSIAYAKHNNQFKQIVLDNIITDSNIESYYGTWCEGTLFFASKYHQAKGLMFFCFAILKEIMIKMNYKYHIGRAVNKRSIGIMIKFGGQIVDKIKYVDYIFDDGRSCKKYFDDLEFKWGYSQAFVHNLKSMCCYMAFFDINGHGKRTEIQRIINDSIKQYIQTHSAKSQSKM